MLKDARWQDIQNDKEKYQAYLCSREWGVLKEAVRERSGGTCERCKILPQDATHHLTYERKYAESIDDLQAICTPCHEFTHGKASHDPLMSQSAFRYLMSCRSAGKKAVPYQLLFGLAQYSDSKLCNELFAIEHVNSLQEITSVFDEGRSFEDIADAIQEALGIDFQFLLWVRCGKPTCRSDACQIIDRFVQLGNFRQYAPGGE